MLGLKLRKKQFSGQTHRETLQEVVCSGIVGYFWGIAGQVLFFPLFGMDVSLTANLKLGLIFGVWGAAKSYFVRRVFNHLHQRED